MNWNVFHFVLKDPRKMMKETGKWVKGKSMLGNMATFCNNLNISYKGLFANKKNKETKEIEIKNSVLEPVEDNREFGMGFEKADDQKCRKRNNPPTQADGGGEKGSIEKGTVEKNDLTKAHGFDVGAMKGKVAACPFSNMSVPAKNDEFTYMGALSFFYYVL